MADKKYTVAGTDIEEVRRLNEVFGFSYNDAKAMLVQAMEVETADQIPLDPLRANAKVDSDVEHLNQVLEGVRISRNLPRS